MPRTAIVLPSDTGGDLTPVRTGVGWSEVVVVGLLACIGTILVHPVGYLLEHPFWHDEAWVAVATKAPLEDFLWVNFHTPPGWAILLRLPWPGEQGLRLVPLAFSALSVVMAYLFGRDLAGGRSMSGRLVGAITGIALLISPWALTRHELKQYTADAFVALAILWLASRVEAQWGRRRLRHLCLAACLAPLITWTSMFVSVAVFVALLAVAHRNKEPTLAREVRRAGAVTASAFALYTLAFIVPNFGSWLIPFWEEFYLRGTPPQVVSEIWLRYTEVMALLPPVWLILAPIALVLATIEVSRKHPATAASVPTLFLVMVAAGVARKYPFLDLRTSHFLLIVGVAVTAAGLCIAILRYLQGRPSRYWALAILVAFLATPAAPHLRAENIRDEDVRSQVRYLQANWSDGDVALFSLFSNFGAGYYWVEDELDFKRTLFFEVRPKTDATLLLAPSRSLADIATALSDAIRIAGEPNSSGRLWIVRSHIVPAEAEAWSTAIDGVDFDLESFDVGPEPLLLIEVRDQG